MIKYIEYEISVKGSIEVSESDNVTKRNVFEYIEDKDITSLIKDADDFEVLEAKIVLV